MMKQLCRVSDCIVGHCPETLDVIQQLAPGMEKKLCVIPHPNYIRNYEDVKAKNLRAKYGFEEKDLVMLHLSSIGAYKNIELLIDTVKEIANPRLKLLIAGKPASSEYGEALFRRIDGNERIKCDFRFIPDSEIPSFYRTCDLVALPYHKQSSLNSGSCYLAFSLRRTVICPDIGTIKALEDHSFVYEYSYQEEAEHAERFRQCIEQMLKGFEENSNILSQKGEAAFEYVSTYHADEIVQRKYKELYDRLL